ncbi:DNA polymerase III subunit epsilon, partial [Mycobacterium tuberculosis]
MGLAAAVPRPPAALVARLLPAGLAYRAVVARAPSLVVCPAPAPAPGPGYPALPLGVPVLPAARFLACLGAVVGGAR